MSMDTVCVACGGRVMGFYTHLYGVNDVAGSADDEARGDGATSYNQHQQCSHADQPVEARGGLRGYMGYRVRWVEEKGVHTLVRIRLGYRLHEAGDPEYKG